MSVRFQNARAEKMPFNIRIQWNAGTSCVSERVLKTQACRGLRAGPSKAMTLQNAQIFLALLLFKKRQGKSPPKHGCLILAEPRSSFGKKCLVSRGCCGREIARLRQLAAMVTASFARDFEGNPKILAAGKAENRAISAAEWLRPPWTLRFCDAVFVPLRRRETLKKQGISQRHRPSAV